MIVYLETKSAIGQCEGLTQLNHNKQKNISSDNQHKAGPVSDDELVLHLSEQHSVQYQCQQSTADGRDYKAKCFSKEKAVALAIKVSAKDIKKDFSNRRRNHSASATKFPSSDCFF